MWFSVAALGQDQPAKTMAWVCNWIVHTGDTYRAGSRRRLWWGCRTSGKAPFTEMPGDQGGTMAGPRTYFSPGESNHRKPGPGCWRPCSCIDHCPSPGLSVGAGNGTLCLQRLQWYLVGSSLGHLPGTRPLGALGHLKLEDRVKDGWKCQLEWGGAYRRKSSLTGQWTSGFHWVHVLLLVRPWGWQ